MKVLIDRYDPDTQIKKTDEFIIEDAVCDGMTVMSLLNYIALHIDHTLAYYRHSVCDHGICGRCILEVNGKVQLACITPIKGCGQIHLAPVSSRTLIRDLVTK